MKTKGSVLSNLPDMREHELSLIPKLSDEPAYKEPVDWVDIIMTYGLLLLMVFLFFGGLYLYLSLP